MCWAQVDFADKNTTLMLEIWQTFVDLSAASGALCVVKLLRAPSCSVTPLDLTRKLEQTQYSGALAVTGAWRGTNRQRLYGKTFMRDGGIDVYVIFTT